jgi:hypothetical protein
MKLKYLLTRLLCVLPAEAASRQEIDAKATEALNRFRQSDGWEAGVDGSVAMLRTPSRASG